MPGRLARIVLLACCLAAPAAGAEPLLVFAAASLTEPLREIGRAWDGGPVDFAFGASSALARQIVAGAPADVFFSADAAQMDVVERAGLVRPAERRRVLSNVLAVVVAADAATAPARAEDLAGVERLAMADPTSVPAGVYAREWLARRNLWTRVAPHVIPTLDVRAAVAAVASAAADAAVVYRTDAATSSRVRVAFEVPAAEAPPIAYVVAPVTASERPEAARAFVRHLAGPAAAAVFRRHGFVVPSGS